LASFRRPLAVTGGTAYTIYSILEITAAVYCIFQYLQRNDSVSWCTIFGRPTEIQFLQNLYSICRQPVLQVVA